MDKLSKSQILNSTLPTTDIFVEEWGGSVTVRGLTAKEFETWDERNKETVKAGSSQMADFVKTVCVNDDGSQMFSSEDLTSLNELSGAILMKIFSGAMELNGIDISEKDDKESKNE